MEILYSYHHRHRSALLSQPVSRAPSFDEESSLPLDELWPPSVPRIVNVAIFVNLMANIFLLIAKLIVTLTSSSLSLLASLVDSSLDFLSTIIIYTVSRIVQHRDWKSRDQFPVGKARLEPLGVLVFSVIMIVSFVQVAVEAVRRLVGNESRELVVLSWQSVVIMLCTGIISFVGLSANEDSGG